MNTQPVNENEQAKTWNGHAGHAWVEMQSSLDRLFQPFEEMLVQAAAARPPRRVLDVGCGAGATTLALARRLGSGAHCLGIDISEPMLATARLRARQEGSHAEFLRANAETHPFEPATFDRIVSRFGVMFFDDSTGAFANLRRAAPARPPRAQARRARPVRLRRSKPRARHPDRRRLGRRRHPAH